MLQQNRNRAPLSRRGWLAAAVGALAISGPAYRLTAERMQKELAPVVVKAGQELSGRLGHHP